MTERSPNAYLLSLVLHATAAVLLVYLAYGLVTKPPDSPKIFELVAGAGDNYGATAAPALGGPNGLKIRIPRSVTTPLPSPIEPAPMAPAPPAEPVAQEAAPPPVPVASPMTAAPARPLPRTTAKAPPKPPDFKRLMERTANRRANHLEWLYRRKLAAERRRQMTLAEFLREHPQSAGSAANAPRVEAEGIAGGVIGGSTENKTGGAGGRALTREEGDLLDAYFAFLKARLKENLDNPPDVGNDLSAQVGFFIAADGSISRVHILRSSGSADFDQAVLQAFQRTRPIGPRPDHRSEDVEMEFGTREDDSN